MEENSDYGIGSNLSSPLLKINNQRKMSAAIKLDDPQSKLVFTNTWGLNNNLFSYPEQEEETKTEDENTQ